MIPAFAHHHLPLLSSPGTAGALGGKPHLAAVKEACKSAERIHGALTMAGRYEVAVISDNIDFFHPAPGMAKARNLAWEMIRTTPHFEWVILTRRPEFITGSLPPTWIGKGFQNVCVGLLATGDEGFPEMLETLRNVPVQRRMILFTPSSPPLELAGQLHGIHWVVLSGKPDAGFDTSVIESACHLAGVPFHFHLPEAEIDTCSKDVSLVEDPPWQIHPFGTKIQLFRPTLASLKPVPASTLMPHAPLAHVEINPEPLATFKMKISEPPLAPPAVATNAPTTKLATDTMDLEILIPEFSNAEPDRPKSADADDFERLNHVVRQGFETFIDVGQALTEIRERELWRAGGYTSWAAYCLAHGLTKIHANRLIKSSGVACDLAKVKPVGSTYPVLSPRSEWQIRPLHRLPNAEQQGIAWYRAAERANGQPTAKLISDVVAELMADDSPPAAKPNHKQRIVEVFGRLRTCVSANDPAEQIHGLIAELEKLLKIA
jgi:hypothetical protein